MTDEVCINIVSMDRDDVLYLIDFMDKSDIKYTFNEDEICLKSNEFNNFVDNIHDEVDAHIRSDKKSSHAEQEEIMISLATVANVIRDKFR